MKFPNIEILKEIVSKKEPDSPTTINVNVLINPPKPRAGGNDILANINKLLLKYLENYY